MSIKHIGIAALAAGVIGASAFAFSADAATTATPPAPNSITGSMVKDGTLYGADINPAVVKWFTGTWDNTVTSNSVVDGSLQEKDLSAAVKSKLNSGGGTKGDKGDKGDPGKDAIISVTAQSQLTNRPDSGLHGDWATDELARTASITKQGAVEASKCGATALSCYFYTGSLMDTGTFATIAGAKSPQDGKDIAGTGVRGTIVGIAKFQFYAESDTPDPSKVVAIADGATHPTSRWGAEFFPAGTLVTDLDHQKWGWTYQANQPDTCEEWVNSSAGNSGDIAGIPAC